MKTAMESIKEMVDVNTVIGDAVEAQDGSVIIPVSRLGLGFAAGGSEFDRAGDKEELPFGGGSGAGVSVQPVGFLVVGHNTVRLLPVSNGAIYDRLVDLVPQVIDRIQQTVGSNGEGNGSIQQVQARQQKLEQQIAELQNQLQQRTMSPS